MSKSMINPNNNNFFSLKAKTRLSDIDENTKLPESDLCFQDNGEIYQFEFHKPDIKEVVEIKPGVYSIVETNSGVNIEPTQLRERNLLTSIVNSEKIIHEARTFFSKLHIYEELGEPKTRKILLYSAPGFGKTSTVTHFCLNAIKEDAGTVVLIWPTNQISSDMLLNFLSDNSTFTQECTRLIMVAEDIGGGEREGSHGARAVDSGLLDLLDGIKNVFKLPTFIIATTNYPQNLLSALADRPGRFDLIMRLNTLTYDEKIALLEFIGKKPLSNEDKQCFKGKETEEFSVAHLKEIIVRSRLHDQSIADVVKALIEHRKRFNNNFDDPKNVGFR